MESTGVQDLIQISSETRDLLPSTYTTEQRGFIDIKGHTDRETYLVVTPQQPKQEKCAEGL